jgi:hypothetical protein
MTHKESPYAATIIAVLLLGAWRLFTDGSFRSFWIFLGVVWLLLGVLWLVTVWMKDRTIRFLLRLDTEGRKQALAQMGDDELQREIIDGLDEEPVSEAPPPVERFPFPRRMTRDLVITYAIGTLVAAGGVTLAALTSSPDLRLAGAATALVAALTTIVVAWQRSTLLASAIEISPFAISQVWPDGTRRTMLWRDVWWLRNRPWLGRVELLSPDRRSGIHVHYDRVAFQRAAELIIDYGGFRPRAASGA